MARLECYCIVKDSHKGVYILVIFNIGIPVSFSLRIDMIYSFLKKCFIYS